MLSADARFQVRHEVCPCLCQSLQRRRQHRCQEHDVLIAFNYISFHMIVPLCFGKFCSCVALWGFSCSLKVQFD
jgi:hypothetical protein